jgi:hypothetical protein
MQGTYNYIPEPKFVSRVHNAAAILCSQYMVHVMLFPVTSVLYFNITTYRSMRAMQNIIVFCFLIS